MRVKAFIFVLAGVLAGLTAMAQGTVNFANAAAGVNAPIRCTDGTLLSGSAFKADLWYGPAGIAAGDVFNPSLQSLGLAVNFATGAVAGYFFGGTQTLPISPTVVSLQVRVWRASDGATSAAASAGGLIGASQVIQVPLGANPGPVPNMVGLQPFGFGPLSNPEGWCIPEPSTVGLLSFGATAFFFLRRRTGQPSKL